MVCLSGTFANWLLWYIGNKPGGTLTSACWRRLCVVTFDLVDIRVLDRRASVIPAYLYSQVTLIQHQERSEQCPVSSVHFVNTIVVFN